MKARRNSQSCDVYFYLFCQLANEYSAVSLSHAFSDGNDQNRTAYFDFDKTILSRY